MLQSAAEAIKGVHLHEIQGSEKNLFNVKIRKNFRKQNILFWAPLKRRSSKENVPKRVVSLRAARHDTTHTRRHITSFEKGTHKNGELNSVKCLRVMKVKTLTR